jgi:hypothetical protein
MVLSKSGMLVQELAVEAGVQFIPEFQFFHAGQMEKVQGSKRAAVEDLLRKKVEKPAAQNLISSQGERTQRTKSD